MEGFVGLEKVGFKWLNCFDRVGEKALQDPHHHHQHHYFVGDVQWMKLAEGEELRRNTTTFQQACRAGSADVSEAVLEE